jgi:putative transposase
MLSNVRTSYKVRAYPTQEQAAVLSRTFGCVRLVLVLAGCRSRLD